MVLWERNCDSEASDPPAIDQWQSGVRHRDREHRVDLASAAPSLLGDAAHGLVPSSGADSQVLHSRITHIHDSVAHM